MSLEVRHGSNTKGNGHKNLALLVIDSKQHLYPGKIGMEPR